MRKQDCLALLVAVVASMAFCIGTRYWVLIVSELGADRVPTECPHAAEGQAAARRASLLARCSSLTTDLAAAAASHGTLLLVAADWGMFELFGVNWLTHVQRSGLDNYLMVAVDQVGATNTLEFLHTCISTLTHWQCRAGTTSSAGAGPK